MVESLSAADSWLVRVRCCSTGPRRPGDMVHRCAADGRRVIPHARTMAARASDECAVQASQASRNGHPLSGLWSGTHRRRYLRTRKSHVRIVQGAPHSFGRWLRPAESSSRQPVKPVASETTRLRNASVLNSRVGLRLLTEISRNAHLHLKTPAGPRGMLPSAGSMSTARCTDVCGLEEGSV